MKKNIVSEINLKLKHSLIKAPVFDEKRFINDEECVEYITLKLSNWNNHSFLSHEIPTSGEIQYSQTPYGYMYIFFPSYAQNYKEYQVHYDRILNEQKSNFVISSYSDSFTQVLQQLYSFLPQYKKIKFKAFEYSKISLSIIKNEIVISCNNNTTTETILEYDKIKFENLVLFLNPSVLWLAHLFHDDDRVKIYSIFKTPTYIPFPIRTPTDHRMYITASIDAQNKEKFINYNDLPKDYWPD
jgi:hypothetical protein